MKRTLVLAALTWLGCQHAKEEERKDEAPTPQERPGAEPSRAPDRTSPREQRPPTKRPDAPPDARPPAEEGRPELAMSPEGLMTEAGPRLIQQALIERGLLVAEHTTGALDAETSAALRKFQDAEGLARTGAPDRETVRKLGLKLGKVFR